MYVNFEDEIFLKEGRIVTPRFLSYFTVIYFGIILVFYRVE